MLWEFNFLLLLLSEAFADELDLPNHKYPIAITTINPTIKISSILSFDFSLFPLPTSLTAISVQFSFFSLNFYFAFSRRLFYFFNFIL